jgi:O-antigen ligase
MGILWFRAGAGNNALTAQFGVLGSAASATTDNIAITLLLFSILVPAFLPRSRQIIRLLGRHIVYALLAFWVIASCLWSQFPLVSVQWAPVAALSIVFAFYLYSRFSKAQQLRLLFICGYICLGLSFGLALFAPQYGVDHTSIAGAWRGMYAHKNLCAMTTLFLLPAAVYDTTASRISKAWRMLYICLSVLLVVMTQSVTGEIVLGCLFIFCFAVAWLPRLEVRERMIALLIGLVSSVALLSVAIVDERSIAFMLGKDPTLTGRTAIWASVMPAILKRPILGYGFRAFWRGYQGESAAVSLATHWAVPSAHNGLLEIWLTLGLIGVLLVAYLFVKTCRDGLTCLRANGNPYLSWCMCIVFLTIITSADEGELVSPNGIMWILFVLASIGLAEGATSLRLGHRID